MESTVHLCNKNVLLSGNLNMLIYAKKQKLLLLLGIRVITLELLMILSNIIISSRSHRFISEYLGQCQLVTGHKLQ